MTHHFCTDCLLDLELAATAPSMPAFTDLCDLDITALKLPRVARDAAPAASRRTNGLRAYAPLCDCPTPAPCDSRCLHCGGSL